MEIHTDQEPDTEPVAADALQLLRDFLRDRDVSCPVCKYNLRDLTVATCPECKRVLSLNVGVDDDAGIGWLIATIVPGAFSGIAALFLFVIIVLSMQGNPAPTWEPFVIDGFGLLSGLVAVGLMVLRRRFLSLRRETQAAWCYGVWTVHIFAFLLLLTMMLA